MLSIAALRDHEPKLREMVNRFIELLQTKSGKPINITETFACFTLDTMGEIIYSIDFATIRNGGIHPIVEPLRAGVNIIGRFTPVPWLFLVLVSIPGMSRQWIGFKKLCSDLLGERLREKEKSDVSRSLNTAKDCDSILITTRYSNTFSNPMTRTRIPTPSWLISWQLWQPAGTQRRSFTNYAAEDC